MKTYTVKFTEPAWSSVLVQVQHIGVEKKAPLNASRWLTRLRAAVDSLADLPRRNGVDQVQSKSLGTDVYRMVFERTYLFLYTVNDDTTAVEIIAFYHGARQFSDP